MNQLELALAAEIEKLKKQNEKMRQLATREGFYRAYFSECKNAVSNQEAFNKVNDLYFELFKEYRYACWNSFKRSKNHFLNNQQ